MPKVTPRRPRRRPPTGRPPERLEQITANVKAYARLVWAVVGLLVALGVLIAALKG